MERFCCQKKKNKKPKNPKNPKNPNPLTRWESKALVMDVLANDKPYT